MRVLADDLADLALADGLDGRVHHKGLGYQAQDAPQAGARAVDDRRSTHDGNVHGKERLADLHVRALAQDHGQDVRATRGRADVKDKGASQRGEKHGKADVQGEVSRDGLRHREDPLEERDVRGERDGGKRAPDHGLAIKEHKAQDDERHVEHPHKR